MFTIDEITHDKGGVCRAILRSLPEWFGIPEAIERYAAEVETLRVLGATASGSVIGFLALKPQSEAAVEAVVLGVRREWHRRGVGRALFAAAEAHAIQGGARFLTVKTLSADRPDPHYAATRRFYEAIGFFPIEVFPELWGPRIPCLLMLKPLATGTPDRSPADPR